LHGLSHDLELWSRFTVAEQMDSGSSCSAPRLCSKSDVAYVKADFWYLSVVTGANEHQSRPPTIIERKLLS
jgi:hypothetical protein